MPFFSDAHNTQIISSQLHDYSHNVTNIYLGGRPGIKKLLEYSIEEASYDSAARWPPPQCHPGTREEHIATLAAWGSSTAKVPSKAVIWIKGPAGVGKSAIAQSSADMLGDMLGGSFFFSRPNARDDPNKFFTTLSHQLATRFPDSGYGDLVDKVIRLDNTIVNKTLRDQFRHLFINPLRTLIDMKKPFPSRMIIIDGLDECRGEDSQTAIVDIIVNSILAGTTPFRWLILSRLEPHLVAAFGSQAAGQCVHQIELTISPELNPEIHCFFTGRLNEIRVKRGIGSSWPAAEDIITLVDLSAGLFAHSHALILFINDPDSEGPQHQLRVVLSLATEIKQAGQKHPLAALDFFYDTLVLKRIPETRRKAIQQILLVRSLGHSVQLKFSERAEMIGNVLGKTEDQFRDLCRSLHSVMTFDKKLRLQFYHASFMDFLEDKRRSKDECIWSDSALALLFDQVRSLLEKVSIIKDDSELEIGIPDRLIPRPPIIWDALIGPTDIIQFYQLLVLAFLKALEMSDLASNNYQHIVPIQEFDFRKIALLPWTMLEGINSETLLFKLKKADIIHPMTTWNIYALIKKVFSKKVRVRSFVLGRPGKEARLVGREDGLLDIHAYSETGLQKYKRCCYERDRGDSVY